MLSLVLYPSLTSTALTEDKVIGTEELAEWTSSDCVHGTRLKIDEHSTGDIFVAGSLKLDQRNGLVKMGCTVSGSYLVEVNVHPLKLEIRGAIVAKTVSLNVL